MGEAKGSEQIRLDVHHGVAVLTIDNPPMNLLTREMLAELGRQVRQLDQQRSVRAVVIRGAGEQLFTAGADLAQIGAALHLPSHEIQAKCMAWLTEVQATLLAIEVSAKPYVVAMKGISYGGGMELAAACDVRVAAENARFALPEVKLGLLPGYGGSQRLARLVGPGRAKHWILTAKDICAAEAHAAGFVDVLTPVGQEFDAALTLAEKLAHSAPLAVRAIKRAINQGNQEPLEQGLLLEQKLFANLLATEDAVEGVRAFVQKRPPKFQGY